MNYYFTFGSNHIDPRGISLDHAYVKIKAKDYMSARKIMFKYRGSVWSMQYTEEQFLPQIEKYGLHEVGITKI